MPGPAHRASLAEFTALYTAVCEAQWYPSEEPPLAVSRWLAVAPLLLRQYQAAIEELEDLEALHD